MPVSFNKFFWNTGNIIGYNFVQTESQVCFKSMDRCYNTSLMFQSELSLFSHGLLLVGD